MKKILIALAFLIIGLLVAGAVLLFESIKADKPEAVVVPTPTTIEERVFERYEAPNLPEKEQYNIYLIGDSMMHALGPRGGLFTELMAEEYPDLFFEVSNYAAANQNIEMLPERLREEVQADHDLLLPPILDGAPDLIIIESYGYNPLSHLGSVEAGLARHREKLDEAMTILTNEFPGTAIFFTATIAPDRLTYGARVLMSPSESLAAQADERIAYIENHMEYARKHNIPLINIYEQSLDDTGDGDVRFINPDDNIHPSFEGIELIAETMMQKLVEEDIFPR